MIESNPVSSFDKQNKQIDSHNLNFILFPKNKELTSTLSTKEPFITEGVYLGLCIKGNARIKINFKEFDLQPEMIIVLLPGQIIHIINKSPDLLIESIYISLDFLIGLTLPKDFSSLFYLRKFPCFKAPKLTVQILLEYYAFIVKQYNRTDNYYRDAIVKGLLYSMIMEFFSIYKQNKTKEQYSPSSRQEELTDNFFKLLITYFRTERSVAFYAGQLCITRKYLSSIIKEVTGKTVLDWIHEVFIIEAKVILKSTNKTIAEISEELNISNPSFFCRLFKKHTGISPLEYRNLQ